MKHRYFWCGAVLVICAIAGVAICTMLWPDVLRSLEYPAFAAEASGAKQPIPSYKPSGFETQIRVLWFSVSACALIAVVMLWRTCHGTLSHVSKCPRTSIRKW